MKSEFIKYIKSKNFLVVFIVLMILSIVQSVDTFYYTKIIPFMAITHLSFQFYATIIILSIPAFLLG